MHSAILPSYNAIGIHNNHMNMTKFVSEEDPGYAAVSTELWRWTKEVKARMQVARPNNFSPPGNQAQQHRPQEWSSYGPSQQMLLPGNHALQYQSNPPSTASIRSFNNATFQPVYQQYRQPDDAVTQGGNTIEGQTSSGTSKVVQGNNIRSEKDVTFNF